MGAETFNKKIILACSPFAWLHEITSEDISELYVFNNLASANAKFVKPGSDAGSDFIDIQRGDGALVRFNKFNLVLDGTDESDITPADAASDATKKGEITFVINEAPDEANSMADFLKTIKGKLNSLFLITVGSGFSHEARNNAAMKKPDGFVRMIGKINNDLELQTNNNPSQITLTFVSYLTDLIDADDLTAVSLFSGATWKLGGGSANKTVTPPDVTSGEAAELLAGDVVITTNITYSYA